MRPLHDMINRENAETMDQKEFKATHDKDIKDKEENLINLERRIDDYILNEGILQKINVSSYTLI